MERAQFERKKRMRISIAPEKCTGCKSCELICSMTKNRVFNSIKSRIKIIELDYLGFSNPVVCIQCEEPRCIGACPTNSLSKGDLGIIHLDLETCSGCGLCVEACVIGAIRLDVERKVPLICDLCGGEPACVKWCPTGCLSFEPGEGLPAREAEDALAYTTEVAKPLLRKWGIPQSALEWYQKPLSKERKRKIGRKLE